MATNIIGVKRQLKRRRFTRRRRTGPPRKYTGQKGWNWFEPILSNTFTTVDNVPGSYDEIAFGRNFITVDPDNVVGGSETKTVVFRTIHMQCQVSVVLDNDLYPYVAYDVGFAKFESTPSGGPNELGVNLKGLQLETNNRVFFHKRVWAAAQPGLVTVGEEPTQAYGVNAMSSFLDITIHPNIPLAENEFLAVVLSQCESELYVDGTEALLTGYIKSWVQIK